MLANRKGLNSSWNSTPRNEIFIYVSTTINYYYASTDASYDTYIVVR